VERRLVKLFVAICLPREIAIPLASFRDAYLGAAHGVRWTDRDDLHITLKFLGQQNPKSETAIAAELSCISLSHVDVTLRGAGRFVDVGVVFAEVSLSPALRKLQNAVEQKALGLDIPLSERSYRPHISIARVRNYADRRKVLDQMAFSLDEYCKRLPCQSFKATEFTLFQSLAGHYKPLRTFQLS
jgi:RNA 2',3'-cyclic 3'-phosphodiesterase